MREGENLSPGLPQLVSKPRRPIAAKLLGTLTWNPVAMVVALEVRHVGHRGGAADYQKQREQ